MAPPPGPAPLGAGLYVHIPFCSAICPYCDFSVLKGGDDAKERFLTTLMAEVDLVADQGFGDPGQRQLGPSDHSPDAFPDDTFPDHSPGTFPEAFAADPFDTIYLGGGTPTALTPEQLQRLLEHLRRRLDVAADARLFLEANPEDVSPTTLSAWRELGISFLSLGVQSFDDDALAFLGRRHKGGQAQRAVEEALAAGFETVSIDLIFGYRGHTEALWLRDLDRAAALGPQHLSAYQLTLHEGTPFGFRAQRGETLLVEEDPQARLFAAAGQHLAAAGLPPYEVSNYARGPEYRSRHNQKYWHHVPYLGLGPSAHSFRPYPSPIGAAVDGVPDSGLWSGRRFWNHRKVGPWEEAIRNRRLPVEGDEHLGPTSLALESVLLGLRTTDGVHLGRLQERFGIDLLASNQAALDALISDDYLRLTPTAQGLHLQPTERGLAVADALAARLEV